MGVMSIRLNSKEEHILDYLTSQFEKDKSTVIKEILVEKYEDLQDLQVIRKFEAREEKEEIKFFSAEEILETL